MDLVIHQDFVCLTTNIITSKLTANKTIKILSQIHMFGHEKSELKVYNNYKHNYERQVKYMRKKVQLCIRKIEFFTKLHCLER